MNYIDQISRLIKEYNTKLEDHKVANHTFYRLHYINYHNIGDMYSNKNHDFILEPFILPDKMTQEDAFKVLSYLMDSIEFNLSINKVSFKSIKVLNSLLDLDKLGFKRLDFKPYPEYIQDLFVVNGKINLFKISKYYKKYFNWYVPNIKKEEIVDIYKRCGMTFEDLAKEDYKLKNDSVKQPYSKMRLYALKKLENIFFETKEELEIYQKNHNLKNKEIITIDYLGYMAGRCDVIKVTTSNIPSFYSQIDSSSYYNLNRFKSVNEGRNVWDIEEGNLSAIYQAFIERGIKLKNESYLNDCKNNQLINQKDNQYIEKIKRIDIK